jgi:UDP-2,3-diacylglucosamine hydrolase
MPHAFWKDLPPMEPPVTVAGDVHLSPDEPETAARFHRFLEGLEGEGGTLVLLGDLFDSWVGPKQASSDTARPVFERLARLARSGVRLAFLPGNRDYAFAGVDGLPMEVWPDVVRTTWGSRRVLLTHGDLLCSGDRAYQFMRRLLRSAPLRLGLKALPYRAATYLAKGLRGLSTRETRRKAADQTGIDYATARAWMEAADAELLVAGHVHTGVHHRLPGHPPREVLVLKDWDRRGGVVRFTGDRVALAAP